MKAFVKTNNGTFPNVNFYLAWEAFNTMGYSVTCFEEKDIDKLDITVDTPVFAGVTVFKKVLDKLGVNYPPFDCYPKVLEPYYGRTLKKSTLGIEREKFNKDGIPVFVKPVLPKQFTGCVFNSILDLIPITKVPDDTEVWVCEPMEILSEFRAYVHDGEILGVKHYYGEWDLNPSKQFIENVIKNYKPSPIAYGIDFGIIWRHGKYSKLHVDQNGYYPSVKDTIVIETNDGCNLGNYGLDSIHYGEMIVSRWFEIMANGKVVSEIDNRIKTAEEFQKAYGDIKGCENHLKEVKDFYYKPNDFDGKTGKDYRVKDKSEEMKANALKAYAEEIREKLKEEPNE